MRAPSGPISSECFLPAGTARPPRTIGSGLAILPYDKDTIEHQTTNGVVVSVLSVEGLDRALSSDECTHQIKLRFQFGLVHQIISLKHVKYAEWCRLANSRICESAPVSNASILRPGYL
jgi:hypothetical protein